MKTSLSELTDFYYKELYETLKKLEERRLKLKKKIINYTLVAFVLITLFLWQFSKASLSAETLVFAFVLYTGTGSFIYKFLTRDFVSNFKESIIEPLIRKIDTNLHYFKDVHIPDHHIYASTLFDSPIDKINGNDYVTGKIEDVPIAFSDIHLEKKVKDSKGRTSWHTVFQGLFIVSEFPKSFHSHTYVFPDTAQSLLGEYLGSLVQNNNFFAKGKLVKMDSPEFEKEFVVYSDDQIEARYILTPALMEKLLNFQKRLKEPLSVAFSGKNIYLAVENNQDLFEPSVFHSLLKYKIAMQYVETLHLALGIVEELKLNQKLWSKK